MSEVRAACKQPRDSTVILLLHTEGREMFGLAAKNEGTANMTADVKNSVKV